MRTFYAHILRIWILTINNSDAKKTPNTQLRRLAGNYVVF